MVKIDQVLNVLQNLQKVVFKKAEDLERHIKSTNTQDEAAGDYFEAMAQLNAFACIVDLSKDVDGAAAYNLDQPLWESYALIADKLRSNPKGSEILFREIKYNAVKHGATVDYNPAEGFKKCFIDVTFNMGYRKMILAHSAGQDKLDATYLEVRGLLLSFGEAYLLAEQIDKIDNAALQLNVTPSVIAVALKENKVVDPKVEMPEKEADSQYGKTTTVFPKGSIQFQPAQMLSNDK